MFKLTNKYIFLNHFCLITFFTFFFVLNFYISTKEFQIIILH